MDARIRLSYDRGDLAVTDPLVVQLHTVVGVFSRVNDDLADIGDEGRDLGHAVAVRQIDLLTGIGDPGITVDLHGSGSESARVARYRGSVTG